jgi:mono/diheme cytochrome c family protein
MVDPNAFVVPDFPQGVMPSYAKVLNDQQFADVIAYLMTLK